MKKVDCNIVSNEKCDKCGNFMKANLINRKLTANLCYTCYRKFSQKPILTAREVRKNPSLQSDARIKRNIIVKSHK